MRCFSLRKTIGLAIVVALAACATDDEDKTPPVNTVLGIYELGTGSSESVTNNRVKEDIPKWFAVFDGSGFIGNIEIKPDSGYLTNSDFGACTRMGYKHGMETYTLKDSTLTIEENNDYGHFLVEYVARKKDSGGCL
jgi:hypothetical protein